jgi:bifunctional non-homologous end joining protein LigD
MKIKQLPAGFVIPAQPVLASKPPAGADWVHEIKHDGNRIMVRRDGPTVRLYSRNAYDWTARLAAIAAATELIKAKSFTIDGEAVVLGRTACRGSGSFPVVRRLEPQHDGEDMRNLPFLDRKAAPARLLR